MSLTEAIPLKPAGQGTFWRALAFPYRRLDTVNWNSEVDRSRERMPGCLSEEGACVSAAWRISNAQHSVCFSLLKSSIQMTSPPLPFKQTEYLYSLFCSLLK